MTRHRIEGLWACAGLLLGAFVPARGAAPPPAVVAEASSISAGYPARGAIDGDRFAIGPGFAWKGKAREGSWWWQVRFPMPRAVGAILQVHGDDPTIFRNAPRRYVWQGSLDGMTWRDLEGTDIRYERRLFRVHRLRKADRFQYLRLRILQAEGRYPTLREVEFYAETAATIPFPEWAVLLSTTGNPRLPVSGPAFLSLARSCKGWGHLQAQEVWLGDFDESFVAAEPPPLCALLSGNFIDWCQQKRANWRGVQEVLKKGHLPMWAACGGAQGLAILAQTGVDRPWDCPHCRDERNPRLPIYTHVGHTGKRPCGDYSACVFERGATNVLQTAADPVFAGLPREFKVMESHCGQIEWAPRGWVLIATRGSGGKTKTQCLRVKDRYLYAAQFHIEMAGTKANSRRIMGNFLGLARQWGGYNPQGKPPAEPRPFGRAAAR
jgi:hypothetical protein